MLMIATWTYVPSLFPEFTVAHSPWISPVVRAYSEKFSGAGVSIHTDKQYLKRLEKWGSAAYVVLFDYLKCSSNEAHRMAASIGFQYALYGKGVNDELLKELIPYTSDGNPFVRMTILTTIGEGGRQKEVIPLLVHALDDRDTQVVYAIAMALARTQDERAVGALITLGLSEDISRRETAATALGLLGDRKALDVLRRMLNDAPSVSAAAQLAIDSIQSVPVRSNK